MAEYKDLKEFLNFGLTLAMVADERLQDGFDWTDIVAMVPVFSKLPAAIAGIENIPAELAALRNDDEGRLALINHVKDLYDIADDYAEMLVEQGVRVGLEIGVLVATLRKSRAN